MSSHLTSWCNKVRLVVMMQKTASLSRFYDKNLTSMKRIKKQTRNSNSAYLFCLGQVNSEGLPLDYHGNTIKSVCVTVP